MREIIGSLDIGSNTTKLVVAEIYGPELNILCALDEITYGYRDNHIVNEEELIKTINLLVEHAAETLGFRINKLIVNIPTSSNTFLISDATNLINNEDDKVSSSDILKVMQLSAKNKLNSGDELVGVIPVNFRVGDNETTDPYNKKGKILFVKTVLVTAQKKEIYDIINLIEKCGIEVVDITCTGLVDYYNFKDRSKENKNGIVVNIGDAVTNISSFNKGIYVNNVVLNIGAELIDKDITYVYKLKRNDSRFLKENLALASLRRANPKESLKFINKEGDEVNINQYELTEVVASRVSEMLKNVKKTINHLTKKEISYIIITGGLAELKDFGIAVASVFGDAAVIGNINVIGARNSKYSVALGMIRYFNEKLKLRHREYSTVNDKDIELMCSNDSKISIPSDSILGKVFGYFFDN